MKMKKKSKKILTKFSKKLLKIKNIFSIKDLALVDALIRDGFNIPNNFNTKELNCNYSMCQRIYYL